MAVDMFGDPDTSVRIYNPFTQTPIATYPSYRTAGAAMCIDESKVRKVCISKKRVYSKLHQMEVAVRTVATII